MEQAAKQAPSAIRAAPLELRWRLSLLIGLLLTAALAAAAFVAVQGAREAVQREVGSTLRTAEAHLALLTELLANAHPDHVEATLERWGQGYAGGRHLCVSVVRGEQVREDGCEIPTDAAGVPGWFNLGSDAVVPSMSRHVETAQGSLNVHLTSDPRDELREAWVDVRGLLALMGALAFVVNLCVFVALSRGLRPLANLVRAMDQLGRGQSMTPLDDRGAIEMQILSRGVRELGARLERSRHALRRLHLRNLELQEEERRMVARELHDEIGHHVAAIEMETIRIGRLTPDEDQQRRQRLQQLRNSVVEIHRVSRHLIQRLRPPSIDSLGLSAAMEAMLGRWQADRPEVKLRSNIESGADRLLAPRAVHLYRIVQEAMSNVGRHADAREVSVVLELRGQHVWLWIVDDGNGFDPERPSNGFGLVGMRERVEALAGSLLIHSRPGAGTRIEVSIPIARNEMGAQFIPSRSPVPQFGIEPTTGGATRSDQPGRT